MNRTLDDFKNEVAQEHNYTRWQSVVAIGNGFTVERLNEIALARYIDSVKAEAFESGCLEQRKMCAVFAQVKEQGPKKEHLKCTKSFQAYDYFGDKRVYSINYDSILSAPLPYNPHTKAEKERAAAKD